MKSAFDLKNNLGKITPQSMDDLYVLLDILIPGCLVKAKTVRVAEVRRGEEKERVRKEMVLLKIKVEKIELAQDLRLGGKIVESPPEVEHSYHTIEVEPFTYIEVEKEWKKWEIDKIKAAAKKTEPVLALILDESEADLFLVKDRTEHVLHLKGPGTGKSLGLKGGKQEYYNEIIGILKKRPERHIVLAGPGFAKDELKNILREKEKELFSKLTVERVYETEEAGLSELLDKGILQRLLKTSRIEEETEAVKLLMEQIARKGKAVYGIAETERALEAGAVEKLLIADKNVRKFEKLLEKAEKTGAEVMIISSAHPAGERFAGLGGIGGLLRYRIE
ncbi:MAG: mRNA surveillance protein pelota [Candidatus Aenigmarchaeota archaeon]|nr:mRNA surveillance protein pelota [Candidatus Aenigmarchaeota archaeon]